MLTVFCLLTAVPSTASIRPSELKTTVVFSREDDGVSELRAAAYCDTNQAIYATFLRDQRRVLKLNPTTGKTLAVWENSENYYIKGIDSDDRGYIYLTATPGGQTTFGYIIILDGNLQHIKTVPLVRDVVFGLNGITVAHIGNRYIAYVMINYGPNAIAAYDVTVLGNTALDTTFGQDGLCDFTKLTGYEQAEPLYLAVDSDGTLYVTGNVMRKQTKGDSISKISADGKTLLGALAIDQAYGCAIQNDMILVSCNDGENSRVLVLDKQQLRTVSSFANNTRNGTYTTLDICSDTLYIGFAGAEDADSILSYHLTETDQKPNAETSDSFFVPTAALFTLCAGIFVALIREPKHSK